MPQPAEVHALADPLADAYQKASLRIDALLKELGDDPLKFRKRRALLERRDSILSDMAGLDEEAADWVSKQLPKVYAAGGAVGTTEATSGASDFIWSQVHQEATQRIATKLYQDLLQATQHVTEDVKKLVRKVGQDAALSSALDGKTAKQAAREMARVLKNNGVSAITYANGAKHSLGTYAEMAVRTVTATTYNEGTLNGSAEHGVVYWEVFDGPFCGWASHDDRQALGMIVTRDEASGHPISHPNCRRAFGPRPDVLTPADAKNAVGHVTPGQTKAQIAADQARQKRITKPSPNEPLPPDMAVPNKDAAGLALTDAVKKVPSVEKLIDEGWDPAKAIDEHARLLKNARNVERRARKKAGVSGAAPKTEITVSGKHPAVAEDSAAGHFGNTGTLRQPKAIYDYDEFSKRIGPGSNPHLLWADRIREDTGPGEYIPVQNLTIQGYKVKNGVAVRHDGVSYLMELPEGELLTDAMKAELQKNIATAEAVLKTVPGDMRKHQRGYAFLRGNNPSDAYWAEKYKTPGFKSAMTGGDGSTTVWNDVVNPASIAHELGHNIDSGYFTATNVKISTANTGMLGHFRTWEESAKIDTGISANFSKLGFTETRPGGHSITPGATLNADLPFDGVSTYGSSSIDEDFAESVRLYLKDRREGKIGYLKPQPGQTLGTNVRFSDMFPHRAEILDRVFKQQTDFTATAWHKERTALLKKDLKDLAAVTPDTDLSGFAEHAVKAYGLRRVDVDHVVAQVKDELAEEANQKAAKEALEAAQKAAKEAQAPLTPQDLSFGDKTGIGVKAGNAKKAALKNGATEAEAKQVFNETKAALINARVAELNAERGIVTTVRTSGNPGVMRPDFAEARRLSASRYVHRTKIDPHPKAKVQGAKGASSGAPQQSKSNIAAELGQRMNNKEDWEVFRDYYKQAYAGVDPGPFDAPRNPAGMPNASAATAEAKRQFALDTEASTRVQQWAATSGDSDMKAVAMQMAAKDEFGLTGEAMVRVGAGTYGADRATIEAYYKKVAPFYRRFARRMYEHTQDDFKAQGITEVSVYRGMNFSSKPGWAQAGHNRPLLQPLNSWSANLAVSKRFGSVIFSATIPVERIIGSARTGFGCYNEYEFVIFDTEGLAKVGSGNFAT